jgi:hypothetical protein
VGDAARPLVVVEVAEGLREKPGGVVLAERLLVDGAGELERGLRRCDDAGEDRL